MSNANALLAADSERRSLRIKWAGPTFEDQVANAPEDIVVADGFCALEEQVRRDYLILFNGRAGSTWLTGLLAGRVGIPEEYFNPSFVGSVAATLGTRDPDRFVQALRGKTGANGFFGIEATSEHIAFFGEDRFFGSLREPVVFHLWRDNIVAQAISLFRAVATGQFHRTGADPLPADAHPLFDGPAIGEWLRYLAAVENANFDLLARCGLVGIPLVYETMIANPAGTLATIGGALRAERRQLGTIPSSPYTRNTDEGWAAEAETRFRREHVAVIAAVAEARLAPPLIR